MIGIRHEVVKDGEWEIRNPQDWQKCELFVKGKKIERLHSVTIKIIVDSPTILIYEVVEPYGNEEENPKNSKS